MKVESFFAWKVFGAAANFPLSVFHFQLEGESCLQWFHGAPAVEGGVEGDEGVEARLDLLFLVGIHLVEDLLPEAFLCGEDSEGVALVDDAGMLGGNLDGQGEAAEGIDEAVGLGLEAGPYAATGYAIDIGAAQAAAVGHTLGESDVEVFDALLHLGLGLGREGAREGGAGGIAVGGHGIGGDAELLAQELADFGHGGKDADAAREGGGMGHDGGGKAAHLVAGRGGHAAHGHDDGLDFAGLAHGVGHGLGGGDGTAGGVDTENDGLDVLIVDGGVEGTHDIVAIDGGLAARGAARHYIAFGIDEGDLVGRLGGLVLGGITVGLDDLGHAAGVVEEGAHVLREAEGVDKAGLEGFLGDVAGEVVGKVVELLGGEAAVVGHDGGGIVPDGVDVGVDLLAVGVGHIGADVGLAGALVGTGGGADELHVDAEFVEESFVEEDFGTDATEVDGAGGMDAYLVGHGGQEIFGLGEALAIGEDGLGALLAEGVEGEHELFGLGPGDIGAAEVEVEGIDGGVGGGKVEGCEELLEGGAAALAKEGGYLGGFALVDGLGEVELDGEVGAGDGHLVGRRGAEGRGQGGGKNEEEDDAGDLDGDEDTNGGGQYGASEGHWLMLFLGHGFIISN